MQRLSHQIRCFNGFTLDLTRGCLQRGAQEIKLRPKPFEVLKYLVENPGRLINKAELIQSIWPDTAVTDDSLVQCLIEVRRALGDDTQQIIKTVQRRGYIFDRPVSDNVSIAPVTTVTEETGVQIIIEEEETNGHGVIKTTESATTLGAGLISARRATSFQHLAKALKQHRWIATFAVITVALAAAAAVYFNRPVEAVDSIAVMPFVNVSGDPNTEYLSDGISDNIIDRLSQLPNLKKVIALNSVLRYKGKQTDPQTVGRELNVRVVLMGRLVQRGDEVSLSMELIDVRDNKHLWGGQYDRKLADIGTVQSEIAQDISERLRLQLSGEEKQQLTRRYTENSEAYQLYLMGGYYRRARTEKGLQKSVECFEQAINKDPNYAPAYAGLASTYALIGYTGILPPKEARQKLEWATLKALELDDKLPEAHSMMAIVRRLDLDWRAGEEEDKRALELDPNSAGAHQNYAYHLQTAGRFDEAMLHLKRAQELDPLSLILGANIGSLLYVMRQHDQAVEQLQKTIEMDPNFAPAHNRLERAYLAKGMYEAAIAEQKKTIALDPPMGRWRRTSDLGYAYAVAGQRAEAQKILSELQELSKQRYVAPFNFALIYVGLGDKEQAFAWLEKAYQEYPLSLDSIKVDPELDTLRSDPRFTDLLVRMKLAT
jgi:TolB-like protein/DNA-binding winged helix-turn-helix (wHTH) protein/Tfp pilus assembly protein PilF